MPGPESEALAKESLSVLKDSGVKIVDLSVSLATKAAQIASECRVRGCDAVYLALAEQLSESLVTLDKQQHERGGAVVQTVKL
jgi:predicted nucleic acid-binding protein